MFRESSVVVSGEVEELVSSQGSGSRAWLCLVK